MVTAIVAVAGTLLGSILTYLIQRDSAKRTERLAAMKELRFERLGLYSDFAGAIMEFRRAEHDWWHTKNEDGDSSKTREARLESYRLRGIALHTFHRIQLVTPGEDEMIDLALQAYEITAKLHKAPTSQELNLRGKLAREKLEEFIAGAATIIDSTHATPTRKSSISIIGGVGDHHSNLLESPPEPSVPP